MNRLVGFLAIFVLLSRSALTAPELSAPSCQTVSVELVPCLGFLQKKTSDPLPACCSGTKKIGNIVKTQQDRQATCECLKNLLAHAGPYDKNLIPQIPTKCGVPITLPPIDDKTDCSKVLAEHDF